MTGTQEARWRYRTETGFGPGNDGENVMLGWALLFAIVAFAAFYFGFFALAGLAASIAKILFVIFLVLLVVSFIMRAIRGRSVV